MTSNGLNDYLYICSYLNSFHKQTGFVLLRVSQIKNVFIGKYLA